MTGEQKQELDRRSALGLIGKGSAAVVMGAGVLGAGRRDALDVDLARVRYEFDGGPDAIPLDRILPDDGDAAHFEAARESLRFRVRALARVLLDRNRSTREQLLVAKHGMLKAQDAIHAVMNELTAGSTTPRLARARAHEAFREYIVVLRNC